MAKTLLHGVCEIFLPMFSSRIFMVSQLICKSIIHLEKTVAHYTMECYTAEIKKELLPFVTAWMELESIMISGINQSMEEKYHMISLICGI